ncbi:FERM domain-containing protein 4A-like isoform X2 [Watersipora subatra]|uniref:FERM domain-containing protein 4A-like isoform X2 n=1 Tax=Watersipora subatra TaxID=2589382 RepID=UPI00355C9632
MAECRKVQVVLLDDRRLTFNVQSKMYTCDLFDIVSSHFNLKEKEYFGLFYLDETCNQQWLQTDRKVLDHDLPRRSEAVMLYFAVRFYIENLCYLQDSVSVELYYLQARNSVYKDLLECDSNTVFELAAYALQVAQSNISNDTQARDALKRLQVFPTSTLRDHPSMQYCEDQVLSRYYNLNGLRRGHAMLSYMEVVEKLPTYGIHYYEVRNKQGVASWLGLSFKGIAQYDYEDKRNPHKVFPWKYLENLYFRDKKFSIEVHDPKRVVHTLSSFNLYEDAIREPVEECDDLSDAISDPTTQVSVSRRTFGPSNVNVYAWFTSKPQLTKSIWSMAVCQHQFFLDRLQNKSTLMVKRCPNVIADELGLPRTQSVQTMNRLNSHVSLEESALNSLNMESNKKLQRDRSKPDLSPEEKAKQLEVYKGLEEKKKKLEKDLQEKIKALKKLCLEESEITGELPQEYTSFMAPGEKTPTVQRRMGTAFSIAELVAGKNSDLTKLEMEYELQKQILKAKEKLSHDESLSKNVRKKHTAGYVEARSKLKELEQKLKTARSQAGCDSSSFTSEGQTASEGSLGPCSEDNASLGSVESATALGKSPKKSPSSQQLEFLEQSPGTRRRMNSGSRISNATKTSSARPFEFSSNPSSTSSLASLSHLEGYSDFTPTKALKYNRTHQLGPSGKMPNVCSATDLNSAGPGTTHSSNSSLHAYSVSGARPLRTGSMDDVRFAASNNVTESSTHPAQPGNPEAAHQNANNSRSKNYITNNPYGSLERKTLKQRRAARVTHEPPPIPNPQIYNPYSTRAIHGYNDVTSRVPPTPPEGYRHVEEAPPVPSARTTVSQAPYRPGGIHQRTDREYAHNVHLTSRRMYESSPQPFQMLDNPYNTHRSNVDNLGRSLADTHIDPIRLDRSSVGSTQLPAPPPRRSSGSHSEQRTPISEQENAFVFFNRLAQYHPVTNNNNAYGKRESASSSEDLVAGRGPPSQLPSTGQEESKSYEISDFYQYSERLRKARGIPGPSPKPPAQPPQPGPRSSLSHTSSTASMQGSRSDSMYTDSYINSKRSDSSSPHNYAHSHLPPGYTNNSSSNSRSVQPRRSMPNSNDCSFNTGDVGDNFSQEMLDWYQGQECDEQTSSTLV